eukprot:snap_masked-scaffold_9-processed-gene-13.35-mRNA-1 protein AED:1.00 eAED:1.00 QI:0/0/0/0/1/1/2/0/172
MNNHLGMTDIRICAADAALYDNYPGKLLDNEPVKVITEETKQQDKSSEDTNVWRLTSCDKWYLCRGDTFNLCYAVPKKPKRRQKGSINKRSYKAIQKILMSIDNYMSCLKMVHESRVEVVRELKLLGLNKTVVTLTNGIMALDITLGEAGAIHVLCRKHCLPTIRTAKSVLD